MRKILFIVGIALILPTVAFAGFADLVMDRVTKNDSSALDVRIDGFGDSTVTISSITTGTLTASRDWTLGTGDTVGTIEIADAGRVYDHDGKNKFTTTAETITISGIVRSITIDVIGTAGDSIYFAVDNETYSYLILSGVEKWYTPDFNGLTLTDPAIKIHAVDSTITSISIYADKVQ